MDSARVQIRLAIEDYETASVDKLEEMAKEGLVSTKLYDQLIAITDTFYEDSRELLSLPVWEQFIVRFPDAPQISNAIDTRDSLALENAKSIGSIEAWKQFLTTYPNSKYRDMVTTKRDSLMVSGYIKNHNESQLRNYVQANKGNVIADMALEHLLKLWTKSGSISSFVAADFHGCTHRALLRFHDRQYGACRRAPVPAGRPGPDRSV
jgi:hypothetical protein